MSGVKSIDVALIGHDVQPSMAFRALAPELSSRGLRVLLAVMNGKDCATVDPEIIRASRCVLLGMSSSAQWAACEIAAAQIAKREEVLYGFYSDIFRCHRRGWFSPFREQTSFVFAFNLAEVEDAKICFPKALVVPSGNPTHASYFLRIMTRGEVEEKIGIGSGDQMIFVSGTKYLVVTTQLIEAVVRACASCPNNPKVVFGRHPGDPNQRAVYEELVRKLEYPVIIVDKGELTGSQALCRADILVESTGSLGIEAACKRIPVINFLTKEACDLIEKETGERVWPPCEQGTSIRIDGDVQVLQGFIREMNRFGYLKNWQARVYPTPPEPGKSPAIGIMADTIIKLLGEMAIA